MGREPPDLLETGYSIEMAKPYGKLEGEAARQGESTEDLAAKKPRVGQA
jgi:hypothetical protein